MKETHSLSHVFNVSFADEYGVEASIVIHYLHFWINKNAKSGKNFIEGRTWMYQTMEDIQDQFSYFSHHQTRRIIRNLIAAGVLKTGNFNTTQYERRLWYSFENEEMFGICRNAQMDLGEPTNGFGETRKCNKDIDTKTDTKKDNTAPTPQPSASATELSSLLFNKLVERNPQRKSQNLKKWAYDIDKLMRIDKRTPEQTTQVIEQAFSLDCFWGKVIQSPESLRAHFDKVMDIILHPTKAKREAQEKEDENQRAQENRKWSAFLRHLKFKDHKRIEVYEDSVCFRIGIRSMMWGFTEAKFKTVVLDKLTQWEIPYEVNHPTVRA